MVLLVDVGTVLDEQRRAIGVSEARGTNERVVAKLVGSVDVGAALKEQVCALEVSPLAGPRERRGAGGHDARRGALTFTEYIWLKAGG